ncbi:MAG: hypothetical protein R3207_08550 [Oceanospirillum sp.]|nr:hypothetical protein [Oceanospirillum sp.]
MKSSKKKTRIGFRSNQRDIPAERKVKDNRKGEKREEKGEPEKLQAKKWGHPMSPKSNSLFGLHSLNDCDWHSLRDL